MTDAQRVLQLFRTSNGQLISNATIMAGDYYGTKPIATYTARITDARDLIECECGIDEKTCNASEHIRNVKKNWYQYVGTLPVVEPEPAVVWVDVNLLEKQLAEIRKEYVAAQGWRKRILEVRGKALRRSLDLQLGMSGEVQSVMKGLV